MRERQEDSRLPLILLAAGCVASALFWGLLQRDLFFASDEATWFTIAGPGSLRDFIEPLNGHLLILPFAVGRLVMETIGPGYATFSVLGVLGGVAVGVLMFEYGRRRVGPWLALAPALLILFFGSGWAQLLQGWIGVQQCWAIAFGIGALLLVEHETRRSDIGAAILLILSLASFTSGIAFLAGVAVATLLREDRWRSLPVWMVPALLYGVWKIWSLKFGEDEGSIVNLLWLPGYFVDSLTGTVAGTFGRTDLVAPGQVTALELNGFSFNQAANAFVFTGLVVVGLAFAGRALLRRGVSSTFWSALAVLVVLWAAQGYVLSEGRTATELRYLYGNEVTLLLVVLAALQGFRPSRATLLAVAVVLPLAIIGMVPVVRDGRAGLPEYADEARANLAMFELGGDHVDPDFVPPTSAPGIGADYLYMGAGGYLEAARRHGSVAMPISELERSGDTIRRKADGVLARALWIAPRPAGRKPAGCAPPQSTAAVRLPSGGAIVRVPAASEFVLRRFGDTFGPPLGELPARTFLGLAIPADENPTPWHLAAPAAGTITVCPIR
jgi:hypothetical protein